MERNGLIAQIWGGDLSESDAQLDTPLAGLLGSIMGVPVVTMTSVAKMLRPIAVMEDTEVMEGVTLGDALSEELDMDVPYGALILIQPEGFARNQDLTSKKLGEVLGQIILDMTQGVYSVDAKATVAAEEFLHVAMGSSMVSGKTAGSAHLSRLQ